MRLALHHPSGKGVVTLVVASLTPQCRHHPDKGREFTKLPRKSPPVDYSGVATEAALAAENIPFPQVGQAVGFSRRFCRYGFG